MEIDIYDRSLNKSKRLERYLLDALVFNSTNQDAIDYYEQATFFPDVMCLYDRYGLRIPSSLLWRNRRKPFEVNQDKSTQLRDVSGVKAQFDGPILFLGLINQHYGHFLTEFISRVWALAEIDWREMRFLFARSHVDDYATYELDFFEALGVTRDRFLFSNVPVKLNNVVVPHQSFFLRCEAYANHSHVPRLVATRLLEATPPSLSERPAYLSRSKLTHARQAENEAVLEKHLSDFGVVIYYPEAMRLHEQIRMINSHRLIIGLRGSALHSLIFSLVGQEQHTCVIHEDDDTHGLINYCLFDRLAEANGHYLEAISKKRRDHDRVGIDIGAKIDVDYVLAWLGYKGFLPLAAVSQSIERFTSLGPVASLTLHQAVRGDITLDDPAEANAAGNGRAVEGFSINPKSISPDDIVYRAKLADKSWSDWAIGGQFVGTRGKGQPITGVVISLRGAAADLFNCCYKITFVGSIAVAEGADGTTLDSDDPIESLAITFIARRRT